MYIYIYIYVNICILPRVSWCNGIFYYLYSITTPLFLNFFLGREWQVAVLCILCVRVARACGASVWDVRVECVRVVCAHA